MKPVGYKYDVATKQFEVTVPLKTYFPVRMKGIEGWFVYNSVTQKIRSKKVFNTAQEAFAYAAELELMASRR